MPVRKRETEDQDLGNHRPLIGAEKAEEKHFKEAKKQGEIISGVRSRIDHNR
ncbi:MAG TPA: hypothetical protein VK436_05250 [Methanocella sp.]|nr:hypothetical protein [Methanocella sp.]